MGHFLSLKGHIVHSCHLLSLALRLSAREEAQQYIFTYTKKRILFDYIPNQRCVQEISPILVALSDTN